MQGDYNSAKAKVLKLTFEKCNNSTYVPKKRNLSSDNSDTITGLVKADGSIIDPVNAESATVTDQAESGTVDSVDACHSDEEITAWLRRKFIIVLQNQVRFQTTEYNREERIVRESKLIYYPIDRLRRQELAQ